MTARLIASFVACVVFSACGREQPTHPLTESLLTAASQWSKGPDRTAFAHAELDRIAERVRGVAATQAPSKALAQVVFEEFRFVREVADESLDYVLLPRVLEHRRGSCVGLGSVYLAIAERLGWSMHGVMLPGHFFVVLDENGQSQPIELLHDGEVMPQGWHQQRFGSPAVRSYNRALTREEVLGVVEYDVGNQRRRSGQLHAALRAFEQARKHFPDFAEAHASAGAVAHLLGRIDASFAAYRAAQRIYPSLAGLASNLALLEAERNSQPRL